MAYWRHIEVDESERYLIVSVTIWIYLDLNGDTAVAHDIVDIKATTPLRERTHCLREEVYVLHLFVGQRGVVQLSRPFWVQERTSIRPRYKS